LSSLAQYVPDVEIIGAGSSNGNLFGASVAATDDYLVIGEPRKNSYRGAVHIYERNELGVWARVAGFEHATEWAILGHAVAMGGDLVAVGAKNYTQASPYRPNMGQVWIIQRIAGVWTHTQTIDILSTPEWPGQVHFGQNVAMSNNGHKLVVGHTGNTSGQTGWAWGYTFNVGTGLFEYTNDYRPPGLAGDDLLGCSVDISKDGSIVVVGQCADDDGGTNTGSVQVYWAGTRQQLNAATPIAGSAFGRAVGVGTSIIAIVAPFANSNTGNLYVFELSGGVWVQTKLIQNIKSRAPSRHLGSSTGYFSSLMTDLGRSHITIIDDRIVLVPSKDCNAQGGAGSLWVFDLSDDSYRSLHRYNTGGTTTNYGECAISQNKLLVGCPTSTAGETATSGVVYEIEQANWDPSTGAADTTPPTVTVVSPAVGTTISPTDALVIDVEDETSLQTVILMVRYPSPPNRPTEVIWDGTAFRFPFLESQIVQSPTANQFNIRRTNGWQASPTIQVHAVDSSGNEPT
jgi:hypothetical protein